MGEKPEKQLCIQKPLESEKELRNKLETSGREGFYEEMLVSNIS